MIDEKDTKDGLKPYETWRTYKNVAVVSVAFTLEFIAANGTHNLQSSINAEAGLGTVSLSTNCVGFFVSNIFLSVLITKWLGTKWAVCFSFMTHMPYVACQMYPRFYTLIPSGIFAGLGAGPLWCALCTYIAMSAEAHSIVSKIAPGVLLQRFLGFFFMTYQTNQIWGNLISSLVLSSGNNTAAVKSLNATMIPQLCGANFLANSYAKEALPTQPPEKIQLIAGIYLAFMVGAALLVAVGLDSMKSYEARRKSNGERTGLALLAATVKLLCNPDQLLLIVISTFAGLNLAFFAADFTASFVSCAVGTGSVGYVMMSFGLSNAVGCFIIGCLAKSVGRMPLILGALMVHGGVFVTLLAWRPHVGDFYVMFIIAALWGLCDSVWIVQINTYYGVLFRGQEEVAFSNFRLWESSGQIIAYVLSSYVRTRYKIYILLCCMIVGVSGYLAVEYRQYKKNKKVEATNK